MNDPEISDNLRRIVPTDLSTDTLVAGARHKRRRRQGMVGAVAALALVAVAVPLALNLPTDESIVAQPAASPSDSTERQIFSPERPGPAVCYGEDGFRVNGALDDREAAPLGAVQAWFCGDYPTDRGLGFVGPLEPLTSGVDELVRGVQAEEELHLEAVSCTADDVTLTFAVVLEYEDGSSRVLEGVLGGCRETVDGAVLRQGADKFYDAALAAWERQRGTEVGTNSTEIFCPGPSALLPLRLEGSARVAVCAESPVDARAATYLDGQLQDDVVASLRERMESLEAGAFPTTSTAPEQLRWVAVSDGFGGQLTLVRHEDGVYGAVDALGAKWFWEPHQGLADRLDAALSDADGSDVPLNPYPYDWSVPTTPEPAMGTEDPEKTAGPWVAPGCAGAAEGQLTATTLPDGEVGADGTRVWLCANGFQGAGAPAPPMEPLEDPALVTQAAAAFNELPPMARDRACTMELGPSYLVIYEFADGSRQAVEVQDYGCRPVVAGEVVKDGSKLFTEKLLALWGTQRVNQETAGERPGPLCSVSSSMFTTVPAEATFTSGVACAASTDPGEANAGAGSPAREQAIPEELLRGISTQLATPSEEMMDLQPTGDSIVLLTAAGDPLVLHRLEDDSFTAMQDGEVFSWMPTGEVATALVGLFNS